MLALIPARGGSKGLPGKNIKNLLGKPLIAYTIEAALESASISKVVVSTDCEEIRRVAIEYGAFDIGLRPQKLATDDSAAIDAYVYTIEHLIKNQTVTIDSLCVLLPTSPLRLPSDIDAAIGLFLESNTDSVISYAKEHHPVEWHRYVNDDATFESIFSENLKNRQDNRVSFFPNGSIYVFKSELLLQGKYYSDKSLCYVMPQNRSVDIDTLEDFEYAEFLLRKI